MKKIKPISNKIAKEFGKDYIKILTKYLIRFRKSNTGRLIKSLRSNVVRTTNDLKIVIEGEEYLNYVDRGRRPGKYPPLREISKWAQVKGISQKAVYPIARSIFKFGIKPTNVIQLSNNEFERVFDKWDKTIANELKDDIYIMIDEKLKKIK